MKVTVITIGSMGDVAPFTGLATRLQESGHEVEIATHERFSQFVRDRGVSFRLVPGDPAALLPGGGSVEDGQRKKLGTEPKELLLNLRHVMATVRDLAEGIATAALDSNADVLLLGTTAAPLSWHVAEHLGTRALGVYLQPAHPTGELPPSLVMPRVGSLGTWGNKAATRAIDAVVDTAVTRATRDLRRRLGLRSLSSRSLRGRLETRGWPVCYGFSPTVIERPADWRPGLHVVGYWWPQRPAGWQPPAGLVDFLQAGPPPVYVGLGSGGHGHGDRLNEVVHAALRRAGVRGVIQSGWAGLSAVDDDTIAVDHEPHDWLMPQMAAAVHHAGAGTTAAALRAGAPAITVPIGYDGPLWAQRLASLGVSPGYIPFKSISVENLSAAIRDAVSDSSYQDRARAVASCIDAEDGAGRVTELVDRYAEGSSAAL